MKRYLKIYINAMRRRIVQKLLGNDLRIFVKHTKGGGRYYQLVDMHRLIPYGTRMAVKTGKNEYILIKPGR
jgi:hypothetical protein